MRRLYLLGVAAVVLVVLPFVLSDFRTVQLATAGAYFIAIVGLDVLTGHSGQVSLGHGGLMAVGGYTTAILMAHHGVLDLWTIPLAALVAGAIGLLLGVPALRLSGCSLRSRRRHRGRAADVAQALQRVHRRLDRHHAVRPADAKRSRRGYLGMTNDTWLYALTWTVGVALFLLAWCLVVTVRSRTAGCAGQRSGGDRVGNQRVGVSRHCVRRLRRRTRARRVRCTRSTSPTSARTPTRSSCRCSSWSAPSSAATARSGAQSAARC